MGSLTSSPDLPPPQPRPTVIQQPAPQPSGGTSGSADQSAPEDDTAGADQNQDQSANSPDSGSENSAGADADQQRAAALLRDRRGRESTINTGFRGILESRESQPKRKTLLGG